MKTRVTKTALVAGALLLPLAFGPLIAGYEDTGQHLNDGKARALADVAGDAHHQIDAAKEARIELAMEEAELFANERVSTPAPCVGGFAGPYPCENVDLAAVVPLAELGGVAGNDSWGWTDPVTGDEIALVGTGTGVAFVDVTEPTDPRILGRVETESTSDRIVWRDVKVHQDHAYIVSEVRGHGMQVFDLTRLRNSVGTARKTFEPDVVYEGFGSAHNIAINPETNTAYAVGTNTCAGGLHIIDISNPLDPQPYVSKGETIEGEASNCYASDAYTHDVQCATYRGPDADHQGAEICFAANEDSVTVVRLEEGEEPQLLSKIGYDTAGYTHQGRLTPDHKWFIFNDELDEDPVLGSGKVDRTTTYMVNVEELDRGFVLKDSDEYQPSRSGRYRSSEAAGNVYEDEDGNPLVKAFSHETVSIDHNLEIVGNLIWEANYNAGMRVLTEGPDGFQNGDLDEVGFFDVDPGVDVKAYGDSWNVYPYFESGTVIVSNLGQGLIVLSPDWDAMGYEPYEAPDEDGDDRGRSEDKRKDGDRRPDGDDDRPGNSPDDRPGRP